MDQFGDCAKRSREDFKAGASRGLLLPSLAHDMARPSHTVAALWGVICQFWMQDSMSAKDAMAQEAASRR
jgi:glucose/mannose transport system substrate-binding protein